MGSNICTLDNLTDKQKALLTRFSYIDYDLEKYKELSNKKSVNISDLKTMILNPNTPYLGMAAKRVTGITTTSEELLEEMEENGLTSLEIKDISIDEKTGFFAISFQDAKENTGMSFRGTEVSNVKALIKDSLADVKEYITDNGMQMKQAQEFFDKNKAENDSNYLFGHSLGGNLVEHICLRNADKIKKAFVINPNHINPELIDDEKEDFFSNPEKFECFITGGDWVSELKRASRFESNIKYVKNNNTLKKNILSEHTIESATYGENEMFLETTKEEAYKGHKHTMQRLITRTISSVGNIVRKMYARNKKQEPKLLLEKNPTRDIKRDIKIENFETSDKLFDANKARENLLVIGKNIEENLIEESNEEKMYRE